MVGLTNLQFAMQSNGFTRENGKWTLEPNVLHHMSTAAMRVSFFGPYAAARIPQNIPYFFPPRYPAFFSVTEASPDLFVDIFNQPSVIETVAKYRKLDPYQAERISYLLGGIIRHLSHEDVSRDEIDQRVGFAAQMTKMGEQKSGDAIAASLAMYVLEDVSLDEDREFPGWVYHMADAIREDLVIPQSTADLGLSQTARLRGFVDRVEGRIPRQLPDISDGQETFDGFPTVGAEFHLDPISALENKLWKRLSILNMSQYQPGSYIQLSRNDRGVLEVRMNPSVYPVTIANWNHMRHLIPELDQAFFTITLNRPSGLQNFDWRNAGDAQLLRRLEALGMLSYAALFDNIPRQVGPEEINFGTSYLGQTVKIDSGEYEYSGVWDGNKGNNGQLGMYVGFGKNLPYLAYYLSMGLARPDMLESIDQGSFSRVTHLRHALKMTPDQRKRVFSTVDSLISRDPRLNRASEAGLQIIDILTT